MIETPKLPPSRGDRALAFGLYALGTVMVAMAVHVAAILAIPHRATRDAYARVSTLAARMVLKTVSTDAPTLGDAEPYVDPAIATAFCLYDLAAAPVRVEVGVAGMGFVGVSVHGRDGRTYYGLTNRSASNGSIALVLLTPRQLERALARDPDDASVTDLRVTVPESEGFVEVRVLATEPSATAAARATAGHLSCTAAPIP